MTTAVALAIDDDPVNLHIIQEIFERADLLSVVCVDSGEQGLAILERGSPNIELVILDRMMPGADGLEVLRRMKAIPRLADIPVIMQTAAAAPEQVAEGLRAGAYYYLTKPYTPDALGIIVRVALEDRQMRRELGAREPAPLAALSLLAGATFEYRTIEQAAALATLLSSCCPQPNIARIGLMELLVNAIEHGNLGISYAAKSDLKREDRWEAEIERRLELPEYRDKTATVAFERASDELRFAITDGGPGFDWRPYLDFAPSRAYDPNGRGIALTRRSFRRLEYQGTGNRVLACVAAS